MSSIYFGQPVALLAKALCWRGSGIALGNLAPFVILTIVVLVSGIHLSLEVAWHGVDEFGTACVSWTSMALGTHICAFCVRRQWQPLRLPLSGFADGKGQSQDSR